MKVLREGFTTGSCAAAAALACCLWQRDGACPNQVRITVPEGRDYIPEILPHPDGSCGVLKDSGVTSVLIGASRPQQIVENAAIVNAAPFTQQELDEIERIAAVR